jgi:hypothetical protein
MNVGSTVGQQDQHYNTYYGSSSYRGGDITYVFVPPTSRLYSFQLASQDPNAGLLAYATTAAPCATSVSISSSSFLIFQGSSARSFSLTAGVPFYVIVDSDRTYEGTYELIIN